MLVVHWNELSCHCDRHFACAIIIHVNLNPTGWPWIVIEIVKYLQKESLLIRVNHSHILTLLTKLTQHFSTFSICPIKCVVSLFACLFVPRVHISKSFETLGPYIASSYLTVYCINTIYLYFSGFGFVSSHVPSIFSEILEL